MKLEEENSHYRGNVSNGRDLHEESIGEWKGTGV